MFVHEKDGMFDGCQFPVYDAHGNMVLTIARTGTSDTNPAYTSSNRRAFDVWGSVRASNNLGIPTNKQRYCANQGHVEDDESGLIYMRARFYEPWTGRIVSEDPVHHKFNWYVYASNCPAMFKDSTGQFTFIDFLLWLNTIISSVNGAVSAIVGGIGLSGLGESLASAASSLQVEEAWSAFMDVWNWSPLLALGVSDSAQFLSDLVSALSGYIGLAGPGVAAFAGYALNIVSLIIIGARLATLSLGYSMRLE